MKWSTEIRILPDHLEDDTYIRQQIAQQLHLEIKDIHHIQLVKRSIDARGKFAKFVLKYDVYADELPTPREQFSSNLPDVHNAPKVNIIGAGPAGYFCALRLIELGFKPIIVDRGKDVQARRRDLRSIQQDHIVNPHSNYCFGEGGAGTYSDGKLYTRSDKRGNINAILNILVEHGATEDILFESHPHIGSNKLPIIVSNIRETILRCGGEIHFNTHINDFIIQNKILKGIRSLDKEFIAEATVLATGHSARDIYYLLVQKQIQIEAKPFALGVRIEHKQSLIDSIQYHTETRHKALPASSYAVVCQQFGKGVFSFCMCPGGLIVPAATAPGEIVTNGMSLSRRDSPFANSGYVTAVDGSDFKDFAKFGILQGLKFQESVEQMAFKAGDGSQAAPAQGLIDFVNGKQSKDLPECSYIPGIFSAELGGILPNGVHERLKAGLLYLKHQMPAYFTNDAVLLATESRTSSPIKIPRNTQSLQHPQVVGLYPCGEGAGYAGGIISAAIDGHNIASAIGQQNG